MKRTLLLCLFAICYLYNLSGQFEIKSNVLGLASNNYNGQVELLLNDKSGIELEVSYRQTPWILGLSGSEIKNNAFRTLVSYKYYIGAEDPTAGLYFGPYVKLKVAGLENVPSDIDPDYTGGSALPEELKIFNNAFFIGLNAGQKIVFDNGILIEYYGGLGYGAFNSVQIRDDIPAEGEAALGVQSNSFTWPWDFRLGVSLGYRFWR